MAINNRDRNNTTRQRTRTIFVPVGGGGSKIETEELSVSENGTYEAGEDKAYSKVTVKVTEPLGTVKIADYGIKFSDSSFSQVPEWADFEGVTDMTNMFTSCLSLTTVSGLDTSKVTNMEGMFQSCYSLTSISPMNTSQVTTMKEMFYNCSSLATVPPMDTSQVTDMMKMFQGCTSLISVPEIDTSNVTNMLNMFYNCGKLTSIPPIDTSNVTNMFSMFEYCKYLTNVPEMDTSRVTNMKYIFRSCLSLTDLGGFIGLKANLVLSFCPNLTHESLVNVITKAADVTEAPATLTLGTDHLAKLTDEEKAIATGKGWTLA